MKNTNNALWRLYMKFPSNSNFMSGGYLVSHSRVNGEWVYTIVGKNDYTYIITEMQGAYLVKVYLNDKFLLEFTDIVENANKFYR